MTRPACSPRTRCRWRLAGTLAAVAWLFPVAVPAAGTVASGQEPVVTLGESTAEIIFPTATRHAVFLQKAENVRRLYARGDTIFDAKDPTRAWIVGRVNADRVLLRNGQTGRRLSVPAGRPIPGLAGLIFTGTVMLDRVQYRYRSVDRVMHPDPALVSLEGSRAVLEVEAVNRSAPVSDGHSRVVARAASDPALPPRAKLDAGFLEQVRVKETGPGIYDVSAADMQTLLENTGRVLADLSPIVLPVLSMKTGVQYRISSAASDGVIGKQGFTVTAPKLAERAGIEVGDTILSVNGQSVDGLASLYAIYRSIRRSPALTTIQMQFERQGARLTRTFRIR